MKEDIQAPSLGMRTLAGILWMLATRATNLACEGVRLAVLAQLLSPEDFGIFGIALLSLSLLEVISETGFQYAIIQKRGSVANYLNTAWTLMLLRGAGVAVLLYCLAPSISTAFSVPTAAPIIQAIALASVFKYAQNIRAVLFEKELHFDLYFKYQTAGSLATCVVSVLAALIEPTAWSLAVGFLAGNVARSTASYLIAPFRPQLELRREAVTELWGFGRWISASTVLIVLLTQCDDWLVTILLGAHALGLYQLAYRIGCIPHTELNHFTTKVVFAAYAKLRDDPSRLRWMFERVLAGLIYLSLPISLLTCLFAGSLIDAFLGDKWLMMAPALAILSLCGFMRFLDGACGALFFAVGRPDIRTKLQLLQLGALLILLLPMTRWYGISGTAAAATTSVALFTPVALLIALRFLDLSLARIARQTRVAGIGALCLLAPLTFCSFFIAGPLPLIPLLSALTVGFILYSLHGYFSWIRPAAGNIRELHLLFTGSGASESNDNS